MNSSRDWVMHVRPISRWRGLRLGGGSLVALVALAVLVVLVVLSAAIGPSRVWANPVDSFGFGARGAAMGRAQTAAADDGGAGYYNPALLATLSRIHIDLGYQMAIPRLAINDLDSAVNTSRGTVASLTVPGRVAGTRVALGGALFLPDQHITRTRARAAGTPRFALYDNRSQRLFLAANLAVQLTSKLFVGAGIAYMSNTQGQVLLQGRIGFPDPEDSNLALDIDVDLKTIRYGHAGLLYRMRPWLDLGLAYRGGFKLVLEQVFEVRGDVGADGLEPIIRDGFFRLHSISQDLFQPEQVTGGIYARITQRWSVAFDVEWQRWSVYENPAARIAIDLDVGDFDDLIDIPEARPLPELGFRDILLPHLGVEWTAVRSQQREWLLRGGYVFEPSPAPVQMGASNFVDNDKHTVSAGIGLIMRKMSEIVPGPVSLDAFAALTWLAPRLHPKLSAADPVGDYRSTGHVLQLGFMSRWRL